MPAAGHIDGVHLSTYKSGHFCRLPGAVAIRDKVRARQPYHQRVIAAHRLADCLYDLHKKPRPLLHRSAVSIRSPVRCSGEELRDEVTGASDEFHTVESGFFGPESPVGKPLYDLPDSLLCQFFRLLPRKWTKIRRRGSRRHPAVLLFSGVGSGMHQLEKYSASLLMYRLREFPHRPDKAVVINLHHPGLIHPDRVHTGRSRDEQSHMTFRPLPVKGGDLLCHKAVLTPAQIGCGHHKTIFNCARSYGTWGQNPFHSPLLSGSFSGGAAASLPATHTRR